MADQDVCLQVRAPDRLEKNLLAEAPLSLNLPKHVGLIPDGSRRWSKAKNIDLYQAYKLAMEGIVDFITIMFDAGISNLSIFLLSKENLTRPAHDLNSVVEAEIYLLEVLLPKIMTQYQIRIKPVGRLDLLTSNYREALNKICQTGNEEYERTLYLLVAYSPVDEICAIQKDALDTELFLKNLWVPETLDLVIRTGGDKRTSNFLPLQSGFAEIIFIEKKFNDVSKADWQSCLSDYQSRQRRFGL